MVAAPAHEPDELIELFSRISREIRSALDELADWGKADGHAGQYQHDVVADDIARPLLADAGLGVLSEESEPEALDAPVVAVIDPIDGSTNASLGLPWFATSICAVDAHGPLAAVVVNQALGVEYSAVRGQGARRDGDPIAPTPCTRLEEAILVLNDVPERRLPWRQYRVMGAAALDLCAVADGTFDGFIDFGTGLAPWDYLGGALICQEAGASVGPWGGPTELSVLDHAYRTRVWAAATGPLASAVAAELDI